MRAVVVAGSSPVVELDAASVVEADLIVAVDGGAQALVGAGIIPALLVGDMDSIDPATRRWLEHRGVEVLLLPTAKNETDTEVAMRLAVDRGAGEITVYGALGGPRFDHFIGNLLLLTSPWLEGVRVRLVDELHEIFLVKGEVEVAGAPGDIVSLLALTPEVDEVVTEGLLYPLRGETLLQSSTRGVSNMMVDTRARVSHGKGTLLLFHYRDK